MALLEDIGTEITGLKKRVSALERSSQIPNSSGLMRVSAEVAVIVVFTGTQQTASVITTFASLGLPSPMAKQPMAFVAHPTGAYSNIAPQVIAVYNLPENVYGIDAFLIANTTTIDIEIGVRRSARLAAAMGAEHYHFKFFLSYESAE